MTRARSFIPHSYAVGDPKLNSSGFIWIFTEPKYISDISHQFLVLPPVGIKVLRETAARPTSIPDYSDPDFGQLRAAIQVIGLNELLQKLQLLVCTKTQQGTAEAFALQLPITYIFVCPCNGSSGAAKWGTGL